MRNVPLLPEFELADGEMNLIQRLGVREQASSALGDSFLRSLPFTGSILKFEVFWITAC